MSDELELTLNGTAIEVTTTDYTRTLYGAPVFSPPTAAGTDVEYPGFGTVLSGAVVPQPMPWSFMVEVESLDSDPVTGRRRQMDLVSDLAILADPELGEVKALFARKDASGAAVSRYLRTHVTGRPIWAWAPSGGADGTRQSARSRYTIPCVSRFPFFIANAASYEETITNLALTYTVPNTGDRWTGFRLEILADTTYTGTTLIITDHDDATNTISIYFPLTIDNSVGAVLEWWYPASVLGNPLGVRSFLGASRGVMVPTPGGWLDLAADHETKLDFSVSGGTGNMKFKFSVTPIYFSV
jgi:hypothetical protein